MCSELCSALDAPRRKIDRHNATSGGASDLDRQHPYKPGTDHRDSFAYMEVGLSKALQCNSANSCYGCCKCGDLQGDVYREIPWNKVDLGMVGIASTATSDTITGTELLHSIPNRNHFACAAISKSRQCIQLCMHLVVRGLQSVLARVLEDLFDEIGTRFRFGKERLRTQRERGALRAGADCGIFGPHQEPTGAEFRCRNIVRGHLPCFP